MKPHLIFEFAAVVLFILAGVCGFLSSITRGGSARRLNPAFFGVLLLFGTSQLAFLLAHPLADTPPGEIALRSAIALLFFAAAFRAYWRLWKDASEVLSPGEQPGSVPDLGEARQ